MNRIKAAAALALTSLAGALLNVDGGLALV